VGARVVPSKLGIEYASGFPLFGEGGMVEEPSRVGVSIIPEWRAPCWEE
jgi:hypothetical protein